MTLIALMSNFFMNEDPHVRINSRLSVGYKRVCFFYPDKSLVPLRLSRRSHHLSTSLFNTTASPSLTWSAARGFRFPSSKKSTAHDHIAALSLWRQRSNTTTQVWLRPRWDESSLSEPLRLGSIEGEYWSSNWIHNRWYHQRVKCPPRLCIANLPLLATIVHCIVLYCIGLYCIIL